jgi:hypothetical protein
VRAWLLSTGDNVRLHQEIAQGAFLRADMTAATYARLLGQRLTRYVHAKSGKTALRLSASCFLPSDIAPHVDILSPGPGRFPVTTSTAAAAAKESRRGQGLGQDQTLDQAQESGTSRGGIGGGGIPPPPKKITPAVLRAMYDFRSLC